MNNRNSLSSVVNSVESVQPIDLAQQAIDLVHKTSPKNESGVGSFKTSTMLHYPSQLYSPNVSRVTGTQGVRSDGVVVTSSVTFVSRVPSVSPISSNNTALNLVSTSSNSCSAPVHTLSSLCTSSSVATPTHSTYHIPRGAAAVANIAAPRAQGATPIVRTVSQSSGSSGPRYNVVSPKVVPLSTSNSWSRSPLSSLTSAKTSFATSITPVRTVTKSSTPGGASITYHAGTKPATLRASIPPAIRSHLPETSICSLSSKSTLHLTHPVSPAHQKYGSPLQSRNIGTSNANVVYSPSNVVSLSSSNVITQQGIKTQAPQTIAVKVTSASILSSQVLSQTSSNMTVLPSTITVSGPTILTPPLHGNSKNAHLSEHTITVKAPFGPPHLHSKSINSVHSQQSLQTIPKVITQPAQGSSFTVTSITGNFPSHKTNTTGQSSLSQTRPTNLSTNIGRVNINASGVSIGKVVPQPMTTISMSVPVCAVSSSVSTQMTVHSSNASADFPSNAGVVIHRSIPSVSGPSDHPVTSLPQYTISSPFYFESGSHNSYQIQNNLLPSAQYNANSTLRVASVSSVNPSHCEVQPLTKPISSPRPSILRKRPENDNNSNHKAVKNLSAALSVPTVSPSSPKRNDVIISSPSSQSATVDESHANSSLSFQLNKPIEVKQEPVDPSPLHNTDGLCRSGIAVTLNIPQINNINNHLGPDGYSPRKKPRKQQLTGNELHESKLSDSDLESAFPKKIKVETNESYSESECNNNNSDSASNWPASKSSSTSISLPFVMCQRPAMSLMSNYRHNWKARHNHFTRHSDVKPKEEKRHTVNEITSQKMFVQKVNGWKVFHLSGQVGDLVEEEDDAVLGLQRLLTCLEAKLQSKKLYKDIDKDVNRLSELVKANMQRSKIIRDQMQEAQAQMSKIFDHKGKILEIMGKYSNKRSIRRKEKT